ARHHVRTATARLAPTRSHPALPLPRDPKFCRAGFAGGGAAFARSTGATARFRVRPETGVSGRSVSGRSRHGAAGGDRRAGWLQSLTSAADYSIRPAMRTWAGWLV